MYLSHHRSFFQVLSPHTSRRPSHGPADSWTHIQPSCALLWHPRRHRIGQYSGPQFISWVWKAFFSLLGVTVSLSSGYHAQSTGQTERKIQDVGRQNSHGRQNSWNQFLGWAEYAQNSLRQSSTGLTPFQCVLGFQPPLFPWSGEPSDVPAVDYWFRESEGVWDATHHQLQQAVRRQKMAADVRRSASPEYQPGQKFWLSTRDNKLRLPCRKLSPRFVGPFTIREQINPVTYKLQLPPHYRIHLTFHVSLLKRRGRPSRAGRGEGGTVTERWSVTRGELSLWSDSPEF